ncbi:MAG: hypothetical protein GX640_12735 [Fibrobacter sp.]|nr:hypothetical protein [Fibrobacter sp.]
MRSQVLPLQAVTSSGGKAVKAGRYDSAFTKHLVPQREPEITEDNNKIVTIQL